jgi:hypothetical protein
MIVVDTKDFDHVYEMLSQIPGAAETAIVRGINEGVKKGRTRVDAIVRKTYPTLKKKQVFGYLKTKIASPRRLKGQIATSGKNIPAILLGTDPSKPAGRSPVAFTVGAEGTSLAGAFVARAKSSKYVGVFERSGSFRMVPGKGKNKGKEEKRETLIQLRGSSLAEIMNQSGIIDVSMKDIREIVAKETDRQIELFLTGQIKVPPGVRRSLRL